MQVFWFIPTHGDSRYLGKLNRDRSFVHEFDPYS